MHNSDKKFIFFIVFLVFGIVLAVQFRSTLYDKREKSEAVLNIEKLNAQYEEELKISKILSTMIDEVQTSNENLLIDYIDSIRDVDLKREWELARLMAGLTNVKGPGIIIKLDDAERGKKAESSDLLLVHDQDIKIILNELKKAGAQAISIKGERITAISEQVCAGPTVIINKNRHSVPYIIEAIGDPDALYGALAENEHIQLMIRDNVKVDIKKSKEVMIPKYRNKPENHITGLEVLKDEVK